MCRGGYTTIRKCLRDRGWIERDYNSTNSSKELISTCISPCKTKTAVGRRRSWSHDPSHTSFGSGDCREDGEVGVEGEGEEEKGGDMEEEEYQTLVRIYGEG